MMKVVLGEDYVLNEEIRGKTYPMGRWKKIPAKSSFEFCANCHNRDLIAVVMTTQEQRRKTYFVLRREVERAGIVSQKKE